MTKLEEIARAICQEVFGEDADRPYDPERNAGVQDACMEAARAAVEAMRDADALPEFPEWNAHIDAILSEKPDAV
jgi:hypothetical protein